MAIERKINRENVINVITDIYHVCVALLPALYCVNIPILKISLGTVLLIALVPYALIFILTDNNFNNWRAFIPFFLFYAYLVIRADADIAHIVLCVVTLINLWAIGCGSISTEKFRKIIEYFALVNTALILIQTVSYYCFGYKINYLEPSWVYESFRKCYAFRSDPGLYRPSALFLEPSNYTQFCCFALISALFPANDAKVNWRRVALIALGCLLTTSGMGMVIMIGSAAWYALFKKGDFSTLIVRIVKCVIVFAIAVVILMQIPMFQTAFNRVFNEVDGYNAIRGRTGNWNSAIATMQGTDLWFGHGGSAKYPYYLNGLADTIYKYGILGVGLEMICFLHLMRIKVSNYVWCSCIAFIGLFCFAHLTSFFSQVFYFGMILSEYAPDINAVKIRVTQAGAKMKELSKEEIKDIELRILLEVAEFCDNHGIKYFLACGTLLGAVRHKGFIPWDDDVDIAMPRADYEIFVSSFSSENYVMHDFRIDEKYPYPFAKVSDPRTCLIENIESPASMGVYIDIFPIDGLPENEKERKCFFYKLGWRRRVLAWKRNAVCKTEGVVHKIIQIIAKFILKPVSVNSIVYWYDKHVKKYDYETALSVGHFVTKATWGADVKPKSLFSNAIKCEFEQESFWIPSDYETYLTIEYGDYMKLPPEEERVSNHDYMAYWK